jgi:GT2 family glycosyltransferase
MTVDVVVVTRNTAVLTDACVAAIARDSVTHRAIVVDNASTDGTSDLLRHRHPEVTVVVLDANVGFGQAANAGATIGSGEVIVLVNSDAVVEPGFLDGIIEPFHDQHVGMVAAVTLRAQSPEVVDSFGIALDRTLAAYNRLDGLHLDSPAPRLAMPSGAAAAYRRRAFEAVGGFHPALFAYGEDVDLGLRLRNSGWTAAEARNARALHVGAATVGSGSRRQRELGGFSRGFLLRRYGVLRSRAVLRALAVEALVVSWGVLRHGTLVPLVARWRGWHAVTDRQVIPSDTIDEKITMVDALRRIYATRVR